MTDINEGIGAVIDLFTIEVPEGQDKIEGDQLAELKRALTTREDNILDGLRVTAMQMGLMPATVQLALIQSGLGSPQDEATVTAVHARHVAEITELRRQLGQE